MSDFSRRAAGPADVRLFSFSKLGRGGGRRTSPKKTTTRARSKPKNMQYTAQPQIAPNGLDASFVQYLEKRTVRQRKKTSVVVTRMRCRKVGEVYLGGLMQDTTVL